MLSVTSCNSLTFGFSREAGSTIERSSFSTVKHKMKNANHSFHNKYQRTVPLLSIHVLNIYKFAISQSEAGSTVLIFCDIKSLT